MDAARRSHAPMLHAVIGLLLAVMAVLQVAPALGLSDALNTVLSLAAGIGIVVAHGGLALGWKRIAVFIGITFALSFTSEVIGVATGLVFGRYHYTDNLGPKVLGVPPLIQCGYIAMGYTSLVIARIVLGALATPRGGRLLAVAICGAFVMVSWDVAMDPYQSTVSGDWIWHDGGGHFGVPMHNYAGWYATVFAFMVAYLAYESRDPLPAALPHRPLFWSAAVAYYALNGFGIVIAPLVYHPKTPIASPLNYTGTMELLQWSMALVAMFVMGTPVAMALARLATDPGPSGTTRP